MKKAQTEDDANSTSDTKAILANATSQVNADKGLVATTILWHGNAVRALQQASASASNPTEPAPAAATSTVVAAATSLAINAMNYDYVKDLCY
ncbi:hypothetical protein [Rhodanobacter sp. OR87]|uniref:hypothetical protein n=1 Tax=Rhodanobacter sp. OR87 TaxID=1076523 RepID=UPI0012DE028C|nr:hypothetical protein [Rhodanobacter sp. OR87]